MRKVYVCERCGARLRVHRLYIRGTKRLPVDISTDPPEAQMIIRALNPSLTRRSYQFIPIGYWCEHCGYVKIERKSISEIIASLRET